MPNLYYVLSGVTRTSEIPIVSTNQHRKKTSRAKATLLSGRNTILTKSNSLIFLDVQTNNQDDDDDDDSDNEIILAHNTNTLSSTFEREAREETKKKVVFATSTTAPASSSISDTPGVKKDRPQQRKPIHDISPELLKTISSKDVSSNCVLPDVSDNKVSKRKFEMIDSTWRNSRTPMTSILPQETKQYIPKKKKKETPDVYQTQKKSIWQSLFSL